MVLPFWKPRRWPVLLAVVAVSLAMFPVMGCAGWRAAGPAGAPADAGLPKPGVEGFKAELLRGKLEARKAIGGALPAEKESGSAETFHVVRRGETLWDIARRYGIKVSTLVEANEIRNPDLIRPGLRLLILPVDGLIHTVRRGETLWQIADEFNVDITEVVEYNNLDDPNYLKVGQKLVLPGGKADRGNKVARTAAYRRDTGLAWPVRGPVSSRFGPRWGRLHTGIDIAVPHGTPIRAAAGGVVASVGWMGGYGKTVVIQHPEGTRTLYAHASSLLVRKGQEVDAGETIARVGSTGRSTGPHLHFEVIVGGRPQNPMGYLR